MKDWLHWKLHLSVPRPSVVKTVKCERLPQQALLCQSQGSHEKAPTSLGIWLKVELDKPEKQK